MQTFQCPVHNEWRLFGNKLNYTTDNFKVELYPVNVEGHIREATLNLAPSEYCLYEWTDYRLRITGSGQPLVVMQKNLAGLTK
jgi:hypothetical protein